MDSSEQELRRSGRSSRRASYSDPSGRYFDEDEESTGLATPPPHTATTMAKRPRRNSMDSSSDDASSANPSNLSSETPALSPKAHPDEMKHSMQFNMTRDSFIRELYGFMQARGQPISKLPSLGYKELDLFLLYQLVIARGGMDEVTRRQEWKLVYQDLGIPTMSTSASYNTRTNYKKYLYLYELEHCDFPDKNRPKDAKPKYQIGEFIRIVSSVFEGQVFYARILKYRYRDGKNQYYVHYNSWSSSHDEWMREEVLDPLKDSEQRSPETLPNPPPSRSSKSNHLIYDPTVSEKVLNNLVASQKSPKPTQNPLSPASPASFRKNRKATASPAAFSSDYTGGFGTTSSEEEEAANELLMGMERYAQSSSRFSRESSSTHHHHHQIQDSAKRTSNQHNPPYEHFKYPMRANPGEDISKIVHDKRDRPHEQDLIHRNRLHTHVLMGSHHHGEDERERHLIAELLQSVKTKIEGDIVSDYDESTNPNNSASTTKSSSTNNSNDFDDPRSLHDIHESLINLQSSLLATQNSLKHNMKVLKKHHNLHELPPLPLQASKINTRRR